MLHEQINKKLAGIRDSATQLRGDLVRGPSLDLLLATAVRAFVPTSFLLSYRSGLGDI
jgi:hypothetical protein